MTEKIMHKKLTIDSQIALFFKSYITKISSFLIILILIACTPTRVDAFSLGDFMTNIIGGTAQADDSVEVISNSSNNSQNMPLLETSMNPDSKNKTEPDDFVMVQDDSFIYNDGLSIPELKFEKSSISDQIMVYTVDKGDTLSQIAEDFDVSMNTIRWENNLGAGQSIRVGQKLNILPMTGVKHIVKSGDTISSIASKYEADVEDVMIFNDIKKGDKLKQGEIVFVPNGIIKAIVSKPSSSGSVSNTKVQSGYYIRPAVGRITSLYGSRRLRGRGEFHPGVDIGNSRGTSVVASAGGIVVKAVSGCKEGVKRCGSGYGNHIEIMHPNGTTTLYGHLSKTNVSVGQSVSQGQQIGAIGNTGSSTGPHLHFEVQNANGSKMRPPV